MGFSALGSFAAISPSGCSVPTGLWVKVYELGLLLSLLRPRFSLRILVAVPQLLGITGILSFPVHSSLSFPSVILNSSATHVSHGPRTDSHRPAQSPRVLWPWPRNQLTVLFLLHYLHFLNIPILSSLWAPDCAWVANLCLISFLPCLF